MDVILDGTPLLGEPTGVGRYTAGLAGALPQALAPGDSVAVAAFTWRGWPELAAAAPAGVSVRGRRAPARALHAAWRRSEYPPVEWLTGTASLFHATNFVLPPLRRARGVVTVHDLTFLRHPQWVSPATLTLRELVPRSLRRASLALAVSETMRQEILQAYPSLPPERVVVTPNGVDGVFFGADPLATTERQTLGLPSDYVVAVGTREPRKGLDTLRDAWAADAGRELPPLVLVGAAGWGTEPAWDDLGDRVIRTGYLPNRQVARLVAGARALLFPSRYEGFGIPVLEALAAGTAVVCSDLPVLREIAGEHARFVPAGDQGAWREACAQLLSSPGPAAAADARRAHATSFSWQRCAQRTLAAYRIALG